jgi:gliding motility-associated-like protein
MRRIFTLLGFVILPYLGFSQAYPLESNNWYFGTNAGMSFEPASPTGDPISNDNAQILQASEGTTAMSTPTGRLLFYCGTTTGGGFGGYSEVIDSTHALMENGDSLIGGSSSSQNAIAVRQPGSFRYYYIFHVAQLENYTPFGQSTGVGFYYSKIDMEGNNGRGSVIEKNVLIADSATEKISAVLHRNGTDVWVLSHRFGNAQYVTVPITRAGVVLSNVVISEAGIIHKKNESPTDYNVNRGCLKISPNGNRTALAITDPLRIRAGSTSQSYCVVVTKFNNETGEVFDPFLLTYPSSGGFGGFGPYGIEFSPDNAKLYVGDRNGDRVLQYDLCAGSGDSVSVQRSQRIITTNFEPGCLQLGLNGRIYISKVFSGSSAVAVLQRPNVVGAAAAVGFRADAVRLAAGTSQDRGLTNVNQSIFNSLNPQLSFTNLCEGDSVRFKAEAECQGIIAQYSWDFGDPASGANNFSTLKEVRHIYGQPGRYRVGVFVNSGNTQDSVIRIITVTAKARGSILGDRISCKVASQYNLVQDTTAPYNVPVTGYIWHYVTPNQDSTLRGPNTPDNIFVNYDSNGVSRVIGYFITTTQRDEQCISDSLQANVSVDQRIGGIPLGFDSACFNRNLSITLRSPDAPRSQFRFIVNPGSYAQNPLQNDRTYTFTPNGAGRASIRVQGFKDTVNKICWQDSPLARIKVLAPPSDSIYITGDSSVCEPKTHKFLALGGQSNSNYRWRLTNLLSPVNRFDGDTTGDTIGVNFSPSTMNFGDGLYFITAREVSAQGCEGPISRHALHNACISVPNAITANNDGKNDNFFIPNLARYTDNTIEVYTRWGAPVLKKTGYDNSFDFNELPPAVYFYRFRVKVENVERVYTGWFDLIK